MATTADGYMKYLSCLALCFDREMVRHLCNADWGCSAAFVRTLLIMGGSGGHSFFFESDETF